MSKMQMFNSKINSCPMETGSKYNFNTTSNYNIDDIMNQYKPARSNSPVIENTSIVQNLHNYEIEPKKTEINLMIK